MRIKDNAVNVFMVLAKDKKLLDLLKVSSTSMKDIRRQIIEDRIPTDLIEEALPRICIYENPSTISINPIIERGWIEIDIYVPKEIDIVDRRSLLIAERVVEILDYDERKKQGLKPNVTGMGLHYKQRLPNLPVDTRDWKKYGVVFVYDYVI